VRRQVDDSHALAERRGWPVADVYVDDDVNAFSGHLEVIGDDTLQVTVCNEDGSSSSGKNERLDDWRHITLDAVRSVGQLYEPDFLAYLATTSKPELGEFKG
jgi:hypothetical protein